MALERVAYRECLGESSLVNKTLCTFGRAPEIRNKKENRGNYEKTENFSLVIMEIEKIVHDDPLLGVRSNNYIEYSSR